MRITIAQINPTVGDLKGNKGKILKYVRLAKKEKADIVVFPEMVVCGYPPEDLLHKRHFVEDSMKTLKALAGEIKGIAAVVGCVDSDKREHLFNAAAVVSGGQIKGVYHKEELPNYGVFDEKRYFMAGSGNKVFAFGDIIVGINICEDIWVENGTYQKHAKKGAGLLINISSSPYDMDKSRQREALIKKRAQQTKTFICYTNLVGGQDELVFDGGSLVVSPKGQVIAAAKQFEEDLVTVDLDIKPNRKKLKSSEKIIVSKGLPEGKKEKEKGHLVKEISKMEQIYKALVLGTHDYITKNGFKKVLIGISGGIDSSLVAAIAVDAIGKGNVMGVTLPSWYTSRGTRSDAKKLAANLGIKCMEIPIERIFGAYTEGLKETFKGLPADITEENIQARIRGNILMALSNKFGWLVLTTGNKSEVAVGYCTLYGDMSGGFAVIKDVPKTKVYDLAKFRNKGGEVIPESVLARAPSAELRKNQKDQDFLPPYADLDEVLKGYVEEHKSLRAITKRQKMDIVKRMITLVDRNEYKRRQSPPGIKITPRAFGKDWRLPITNKYKEF